MAVDLKDRTLPSLNDLLFTSPQRVQMFELARDSWQLNFDPAELITLTTHPLTDRRRVGEIRKHGLVLRTAYKLLDQRGDGFPPAHRALVSSLGAWKDGFYMQGQEVETLSSQAAAESLGVVPITDLTFSQRVRDTRVAVEQIVEKTTVPGWEFHRMRKYLRHFMNLFALSTRATGDANSQQLWDFLKEVNDRLGKTHDQLIDETRLIGGSYKDKPVQIDPYSQDSIGDFLTSFK